MSGPLAATRSEAAGGDRNRRQTRRAVGALQEGAPDRVRQGGIVELDAQVLTSDSLRVLRRAAQISAAPATMQKSGAAVGVLAVDGDEAHPDAHGEGADGAGVGTPSEPNESQSVGVTD